MSGVVNIGVVNVAQSPRNIQAAKCISYLRVFQRTNIFWLGFVSEYLIFMLSIVFVMYSHNLQSFYLSLIFTQALIVMWPRNISLRKQYSVFSWTHISELDSVKAISNPFKLCRNKMVLKADKLTLDDIILHSALV